MAGFNSIDGLVSGLDTTSIIDAIMDFERRPALFMEVDQAQKTNIISTLKALQAKIYASQATAQRLTQVATFEKGTVSVSDESYLTATASSRVGSGSYDLQVNAIARNHQIASQGLSGDDIMNMGTGTIELGLGSASPQTITIDASNNNLTDIKDAINDAKQGVTATIVNDGSESNQYRLLLTGDTTGQSATISITSNLTGGPDLDFASASFDTPEKLATDSGSSSVISLGATAGFTGDKNKIYTFTVQGTGAQTIGTDTITINWTDGTDSGAIVATQADFEYELVGTGSDGLKLSFSAGELTAGDTFQVQTFAPLLQDAANAEVAFGSTGGAGSPITITSETNRLQGVIAGISIDLKDVTPANQSVTINTDIDTSAVKKSIESFINSFNDIMKFIDDQNTFDPEVGRVGTLLGDSIIQTMQMTLRRVIGDEIEGVSDGFSHLSSIGIRTGSDGRLAIKDSTRLTEAIRDNLDDVIALFSDSGYASTSNISLISAATSAHEGEDYAVDITQAASQGVFNGVNLTDPGGTPLVLDSTNNRLKITLNSKESGEIILTAKSYDSTTELISELQKRIDSDLEIGSAGLTASWEDNGDGTGSIVLTSATYGSGSTVTVDTSNTDSAAIMLGFATGSAVDGLDVVGTINGEEADGRGQYLTGNGDNETTAGLKLKLTHTADQIVAGAEGTITFVKGVASKLNVLMTSLNDPADGLLGRRIKSYQDQVDNLGARIAEFDVRMAMKRERLRLQFQRMEAVLGQLNAQGSAIASQVTSFNSNWSQIASNG